MQPPTLQALLSVSPTGRRKRTVCFSPFYSRFIQSRFSTTTFSSPIITSDPSLCAHCLFLPALVFRHLQFILKQECSHASCCWGHAPARHGAHRRRLPGTAGRALQAHSSFAGCSATSSVIPFRIELHRPSPTQTTLPLPCSRHTPTPLISPLRCATSYKTGQPHAKGGLQRGRK